MWPFATKRVAVNLPPKLNISPSCTQGYSVKALKLSAVSAPAERFFGVAARIQGEVHQGRHRHPGVRQADDVQRAVGQAAGGCAALRQGGGQGWQDRLLHRHSVRGQLQGERMLIGRRFSSMQNIEIQTPSLMVQTHGRHRHGKAPPCGSLEGAMHHSLAAIVSPKKLNCFKLNCMLALSGSVRCGARQGGQRAERHRGRLPERLQEDRPCAAVPRPHGVPPHRTLVPQAEDRHHASARGLGAALQRPYGRAVRHDWDQECHDPGQHGQLHTTSCIGKFNNHHCYHIPSLCCAAAFRGAYVLIAPLIWISMRSALARFPSMARLCVDAGSSVLSPHLGSSIE